MSWTKRQKVALIEYSDFQCPLALLITRFLKVMENLGAQVIRLSPLSSPSLTRTLSWPPPSPKRSENKENFGRCTTWFSKNQSDWSKKKRGGSSSPNTPKIYNWSGEISNRHRLRRDKSQNRKWLQKSGAKAGVTPPSSFFLNGKNWIIPATKTNWKTLFYEALGQSN